MDFSSRIKEETETESKSKQPSLIREIRKSSFLKWYIAIVLVVNFICTLWGIDPSATGMYVVVILSFPLNILLFITGLIRVIIFHFTKAKINLLIYYLIVLVIPVAAIMLSGLLVTLFGNNRGC